MTAIGRTLHLRPSLGRRSPALRTGPAAQVGVALGLSALGGLTIAGTQNGLLALGLFAGAGFTALGLLRPALFTDLFLLARPEIDDYSAVRVGGVPGANIAGAIGLMVVIVLIALVVTRSRLVRPAPTWAFIAVLLTSCLVAVEAVFNFGAAISTDPVSEVVRLLALLAMFLLAANLFNTAEGVQRLFVLLGLSGVIPAVDGIIEWVTGSAVLLEGYDLARISGPFVGPVPFSSFLAVTALIVIGLPREALRPWVRALALAPMLVALVGTYSREGWVLFLIGIVLLEWRRRKVLVLTAVGVAVAIVAAVPSVHERVLPSENQANAGPNSGAFSSYQWRLSNWGGLLDEYAEKPLLGHGLLSVGYVNPRVPVANQGEVGGGYDAHNTGVRVLVEGGLVLLAVYVALFVAVMRSLRRSARADWSLAPYARLALVLWVGITVVALSTNDPFEATAMMYVLLAATGAVGGAWAVRERDRGPAAADAVDR